MGVEFERTGLGGRFVLVGGRRYTHKVDLTEVLCKGTQGKAKMLERIRKLCIPFQF